MEYSEMLLFPKQPKKKKRKIHPKSIMHQKDGTCYLCMLLEDDYRLHRVTQEHHGMFGIANRRLSEEYGLKVYLCIEHHLAGAGLDAVHSNEDIRRLLEEESQRAFERKYKPMLGKTGARKKFYDIFKKNCLGEMED